MDVHRQSSSGLNNRIGLIPLCHAMDFIENVSSVSHLHMLAIDATIWKLHSNASLLKVITMN